MQREQYSGFGAMLGKNLPEFDLTPVDWTLGNPDPQLRQWSDPRVQYWKRGQIGRFRRFQTEPRS